MVTEYVEAEPGRRPQVVDRLQHGPFQADYPEWKQAYDVPMILQEIYEANVDRWVPGVMIDEGKRSVLGVLVDAVDYEAATAQVIDAARERRPLRADRARRARRDDRRAGPGAQRPAQLASTWSRPTASRCAGRSTCCTAPGSPTGSTGPTLTLRVLARCAAEGLPVYLYGSTDDDARPAGPGAGGDVPGAEDRRRARRRSSAPPSPARPPRSPTGSRASGARVVLVGLGCPRQEIFAYAMRPLLDMPLLAVGAAFDYHAGQLRKPPPWMQKRGLEWLWRLGLEPRRLWRRYLILNPAYLARLAAQKTGLWKADPAATGDGAACPSSRSDALEGQGPGVDVARCRREEVVRTGAARPPLPTRRTG